MTYGEYCRFYGNKCRHFTHPNHSGELVTLPYLTSTIPSALFCHRTSSTYNDDDDDVDDDDGADDNACLHLPINIYKYYTGHTRVSLDFRAVSAASGGHDPSFRLGNNIQQS